MNFISEILTAQNEVDLPEINRNITRITEEVAAVKVKLKEHLEHTWTRFNPSATNAEKLLDSVEQTNVDVDDLLRETEMCLINSGASIHSQLNELQQKHEQLKKFKFMLEIAKELTELDEDFDRFTAFSDVKNYPEATGCLNKIRDTLNRPSDIEYIAMYPAIKELYSQSRTQLFLDLTAIWSRYVKITAKSIQIHTSKLTQIKDALTSLGMLGVETLFDQLRTFSVDLKRELFDEILQGGFVQESNENESRIQILTITPANLNVKTYSTCASQLKKLLIFLDSHLNFDVKLEKKVLEMIGDACGDELCSDFIDKFIVNAIPDDFERAGELVEVVGVLNDLQQCMSECGFLIACKSFERFYKDGNVLMTEKVYKRFSERCDDIMRKDLHLCEEIQIDESTFQISKNARELVEFLMEMIVNAPIQADVIKDKLVTTVKDILLKYANFTFSFHKKFIETIPQHAALFHNNCQYIHSKQLPLGEQLSAKTQRPVNPPTNISEHGSKTFEKFLNNQKQMLLDVITNSSLNNLGTSDDSELDANVEKHIRQCLRQLELLQSVWTKVLASDVYERSMSFLLNCLLADLIGKVLRCEDISAQTSEQLVNVFELIRQRAPKVFVDPNQASTLCDQYPRFIELIFLLNAKLTSIDERWADGKGPLTMYFTADEMKNLIRALFQNTDQRAKLLNKIN